MCQRASSTTPARTVRRSWPSSLAISAASPLGRACRRLPAVPARISSAPDRRAAATSTSRSAPSSASSCSLSLLPRPPPQPRRLDTVQWAKCLRHMSNGWDSWAGSPAHGAPRPPGRARPGRLVPRRDRHGRSLRAVTGPALHVPRRDRLGRSNHGRALHGRSVLAAWPGLSSSPRSVIGRVPLTAPGSLRRLLRPRPLR